MSYVPTLVTAPTAKLIELADAKAQLRVDGDDENALIEDCAAAATSVLDGYSGALRRCLIRQKWAQTFDRFSPCMPLPMPALEIAAVKYRDADGVEQTVASSVYELRRTPAGSAAHRLKGQSWPADINNEYASITIEFWAGYGTDAADVPAAIRVAAKMMLAVLFENREGQSDQSPDSLLTAGVRALLRPFALKAL